MAALEEAAKSLKAKPEREVSIKPVSLARHGQTDEQAEKLGQVAEWANESQFRVSFGTTVGKYPQTVILDHGYQDSLLRVEDDGRVTFSGDDIEDYADFEAAVKKFKESPKEE